MSSREMSLTESTIADCCFGKHSAEPPHEHKTLHPRFPDPVLHLHLLDPQNDSDWEPETYIMHVQ